MSITIKSDRGWGFRVSRSSEYFADQWPTELGAQYGDTVRVDAYDQDASIELTPAEARHLANVLMEYAERIETDPMELKRRLS